MKEKEVLYAYCVNYVQQRIARIQGEINKAQSSANEETKSSMGDKYETSRAMAHQEIENNRMQLLEAEKLHSILQNLTGFKVTGTINRVQSSLHPSVFFI